MEPPGADLLGDTGEPAPAIGTLRLSAAVAAVTVIASGRGPGLVVVALLAVVLASVAGAGAAILAGVATWVRWGSGWLVAVGGAQAVLGPAGVVGPPLAAASSWLAAGALIALCPNRSLGSALAVGSAAAFVVAGPAGGDGAALRIAATGVATGLAVVVGRLPWARWRTLAAGAVAIGAVVLAAVS